MNNTLFWHATMKLRAGQFQDAMALFKHILKTRPDYQEALLGATYCAIRLGELGSARLWLDGLENHPLKNRLVMRCEKGGHE